jgi:hypothetical protein
MIFISVWRILQPQKNKDRTTPLAGGDLMLSHFKGQGNQRLVVYLVPSLTAAPAVTKAIRQSFAMISNPSMKEHKAKLNLIPPKKRTNTYYYSTGYSWLKNTAGF